MILAEKLLKLQTSLSRNKRIDIFAHLGNCEGNYLRLKKLLCENQQGKFKSKQIRFESSSEPIDFEVCAVSKYTSTLKITQATKDKFQYLRLKVNLYHDVRCAEVTPTYTFQQKGMFARKDIPNTIRLEKMEMNRFLTEFLDFCLEQRSANQLEELSVDSQQGSA